MPYDEKTVREEKARQMAELYRDFQAAIASGEAVELPFQDLPPDWDKRD